MVLSSFKRLTLKRLKEYELISNSDKYDKEKKLSDSLRKMSISHYVFM